MHRFCAAAWLLTGLALLGASARPAGAQGGHASSRAGGAVPRVLVVGLRSADVGAGRRAADSVRVALGRLAHRAQLWVVPTEDVQATLEGEDAPQAYAVSDIRELGRVLRADVVVDVAAEARGDGVRLVPLLVTPSTPGPPEELAPAEGRDTGAAARVLARRLAADPRLRGERPP